MGSESVINKFKAYLRLGSGCNSSKSIMREVERKFLVRSGAYKDEATTHYLIQQGFLNTDPERTVRIRIKDGLGKITIKGISDAMGVSRSEWEYDIPGEDARKMLELCEGEVIVKRRYLVPVGKHLFEVDVFEGNNAGLVVAEVELESPEEPFEKPSWLGQEVTGDPKYYNAQLSRVNYREW